MPAANCGCCFTDSFLPRYCSLLNSLLAREMQHPVRSLVWAQSARSTAMGMYGSTILEHRDASTEQCRSLEPNTR